MKSLKRSEGYLMVDHRFSPGLPAETARAVGYDPKLAAEGKLLETATVFCSHCLGCVVKNPARIRERAYCAKCDSYICDACDALRHQPTYVHASGRKIHDSVREAGVRGTVLGSPLDLLNPPKILIP
jgi:hypothetical protein